MAALLTSASAIAPQVLSLVILVFGPLLIIKMVKAVRPLGIFGPIFWCYVLGFACSQLYGAFEWDLSLVDTVYQIMVPLSIPLILFGADFGSMRRLARPTVVSFILVIVSVALVTVGAYAVFGRSLGEGAGVSAMLVGLYTGGTPNLYAIGSSLGVSADTVAMTNTCDVILGGVYFLLLLMLSPIAARFARRKAAGVVDSELEAELTERFAADSGKLSIRTLLARAPIFLLAVLCLAVSYGTSLLFESSTMQNLVLFMLVTVMGIAFSFIKKVRTAPGSYATGQYLIYIFSVGIGFMIDLSVFDADFLVLLGYVACVMFGAIVVHFILSAIFRIDICTAIITSTAGIYGPAFIGPVSGAMKNREVVLPGLLCGILGLAIGNFLGIGIAGVLSLI